MALSAKKPSRARLSRPEIDAAAARLSPPWKIEDGALCAEWRFSDFAAVAKMTRAVLRLSEKTDHHPHAEFGYDRFRVRYITHSAGGLSALDFYCAAEISAAVRRCLRA
ncbi:MAG: 4a-hydroxytetrahydrobiopterin dehydratase [Gammaproteobacteria bacterium]